MARAPINPIALGWAREVSHVSVEELAKALNVKPARVAEFEGGDALPTFRQLTLMAAKLDRPLGFFFAPPPAAPDVPETADFRGRGHDELPADLAREMRRAEQHRDAMLDLAGAPARRIPEGAITWKTVAARAAALRKFFGLTDAFVPPESQNNQVFNFWRGLLEENGVLVFQVTKISLATFRGLSVHHDELPMILVNGADSPMGRTFTLFHEVAHLINRTSGLCALRESVDEEAIANNFAANFLMPEPAVRAQLDGPAQPEVAAEQLARHFKVSMLAAAVRLRRLGIIDDADLETLRSASDDSWQRVREAQKQKKGFVPPWRLRYRDLGPTYIGAVAHALEDRRVDMVDATYLLNARLPMVEQLLDEYYRTGGGE
ncbi:XRE family transcriptional regulator [Bogoriella caseilytica]|uniref:Zn-dependent peptidase ImmA (M78 family) n=1 Tax=Bogoriella caseilytica TaxID=56055 RepID=A0A3N2BDT6_9MICO|nr:XRE family transcriptional regulator [Bogoriella caseilytica]ROR73411.1 Zn-dependent peptidase ImmA (M78 family) [Bogoriella caseilytica]